MRLLALTILLMAPATNASAQKKWTDIGTTANGNVVSIDGRSIKRNGNLVSAVVRTVFTPPVKTPAGTWASSRTTGTFDCSRRYLAAKESAYYSDAAQTRLVQRKVNKLPGFGPVLNGSLGGVAADYLCKPR